MARHREADPRRHHPPKSQLDARKLHLPAPRRTPDQSDYRPGVTADAAAYRGSRTPGKRPAAPNSAAARSSATPSRPGAHGTTSPRICEEPWPLPWHRHAAVTDPESVGAQLRAIDGYEGHEVTAHALRLAPLVFVRPGELRAAEWTEIDLDHAEWRIAAHRMKMREPHIVPLARQALDILRSMHFFTGKGRSVFPSLRTFERPMSENIINAALRRLGYSNDEMTGHGFRALASTRLNEQGFAPNLIELQLAHAERDKIRAVYNRAARLAERRSMMQAWADYLDSLRAGTSVAPMKRIA